MPVPMNDDDLEDCLSHFDEKTKEDFDFYLMLQHDNDIEDTKKHLVRYKNNKPIPKNLRKEMIDNLKISLGIEEINHVVIFTLLKIVNYDGNFYKYKGIIGNRIEISDINCDDFYISDGRVVDPVEDALKKELSSWGQGVENPPAFQAGDESYPLK